MKIDVAVQSYKKPESLIYTLLSLHRHSRDEVDKVWINDDCSGGRVLDAYHELAASGALDPWKLNIRENKNRMGWWVSFVRGYNPSYLSLGFKLKRMAWNLYKNKLIYAEKEDIRYQWAINSTDKEYVLVIHDDVEFKDNIISIYLQKIKNREGIAIVGDLGQCWRCDFKAKGCTPQKLLAGYRPSSIWPSTKINNESHAWACRVNEWSALLSVQAAQDITKRDQIFFGNYDANGDVAAYWFSRMVAAGYGFDDPLPLANERDNYYKHWDGGITGHSAWADQGNGKSIYDGQRIKERLVKEFGYTMSS